MSRFKKILVWLKENERHLWTAMFVGGFTTDLITFLPAPLSRGNLLFIIYLSIVIISAVISHYLFTHGYDSKKKIGARVMNVLFPLLQDFFIGALLSGFLIFYTKNSSILASWPFLLMLAVVFFGNELFRDYKKHLAFQVVLIFFSIYAYAIFSLPLALKEISPRIFLASGAITLGVFFLFLLALAFTGWKRLRESGLWIAAGTIGLLLFINISYFTGILPPLPLSLTDAGPYQSITRTDDSYVLVGEPSKPWWDFVEPTIVHLTPGSSLSVFSSVFAPISFSSTIVHKWEFYDTAQHKWVLRAEIAFLISGGRTEGYRGYSTISDVQPGKYEVFIETLSGQVIGETDFTVVSTTQPPTLVTSTK